MKWPVYHLTTFRYQISIKVWTASPSVLMLGTQQQLVIIFRIKRLIKRKKKETRGHRNIFTAPTFKLFIPERRSCSCTWMKSCWSVQKHKVLHSFINTRKQSSVVDSKTFILYWLEKYRDPKRKNKEKKERCSQTIPEHPWLKSPKRLHFINWMQLLTTELMCSK